MIRFEQVSVRFGAVVALETVSLAVEAGVLCTLVGPSGSGKSTLMRLVNRLVEPAGGRVLVRGRDVAGENPALLRRSIGYVMQSTGLFPHRSVAENIATVPLLLGWDRPRIAARVTALLALVRLDPELAERRPAELSGGQAQRVGLARALAADPDILLMDEPFGAVDPLTRRELRAELRRIHADTGKTILLVTHDPEEALELATQVVVLRDGQVVAEGAPAALVAPDAAPFARELLGGGQPGLRRLSLLPASAAWEDAPAPPDAPRLPPGATLADALSCMAETGCNVLGLEEQDGSLRLEAVLAQGR
ncbi:ATP-binding cassette domain-containing protein [Falsiroseomonas selenitidurans]|uniref:ABC transporter ATP-binding protein n=1 Tax=Falsiroseomonas selenitidurans TaxID=2716335 RepID=A0ABX1E8M7_9PROT|nr:ABC transporter ATP-binding protein [Falsiroseomonas selenitidurans]NKC33549.1 ABC transporter ATP-binding protein [Falsiroseomonas selenitidurans]